MDIRRNVLAAGFAFLFVATTQGQDFDDAPQPYGALPSARQLAWQETEMYCLIHFTPTTFQDKEWGYGDADPAIFNPKKFDAEQIVAAAKAGGFKGIITVAKHHDGFALWPTKTASYNISESPWRNGKGDMVKEFQLAAKKLGMKFGVYCSPWDRNNPAYGTPAYVAIYRNQLRELYSNYGPLFASWHDGANGGDGYYGGKKEQRKVDQSTYYDWKNTWAITREMQPNAAIFSDIGPDMRWVGNEKGKAPETSWSTITLHGKHGKTPMPGYMDDSNLGSGTRNGERWIPIECDVALRPGWFYHSSQDNQVKSPAMLFDLYCHSVGRSGALDLGLSPNTDGLLHPNDVKALRDFGRLLKEVFTHNLINKARLEASNIRFNKSERYGIKQLKDQDRYSYWATDDAIHDATLLVDFQEAKEFTIIQIRENIKLGQRVDSVVVDQWKEGQWLPLCKVTSVGANRLIRLDNPTKTTKLRLHFYAPVALAISELGVYAEPKGLRDTRIVAKKGMDKSHWKLAAGQQISTSFAHAFDNRPETIAIGSNKELILDLGRVETIRALGYLPRQDGKQQGILEKYVYYSSLNGTNWTKIAEGEFSNIKANPILQEIKLKDRVRAKYLKLEAVQSIAGQNGAAAFSIAEFEVYQ